MRIQIRKTYYFQHLLLWIGLICVVSYALLENMSIPIALFSSVKMPLLYVGGVCVLFQLNVLLSNFLRKRYFYILFTVLFMCGVAFLSMIVNTDNLFGFSPERTTVRLILYLLELFAFAIVIAENGWSKVALSFIYRYVVVLVLATDVLMFTGLVKFGERDHVYYLIGTKFTVIYMHLNLIALWMVRNWKTEKFRNMPKWKMWLAGLMLVGLASYVDCMSGVLGGGIFVLLLMWLETSERRVKVLTSSATVLLCIFGGILFVTIIGLILENPVIINFVENTLNRSTTLTGRLNIYQDFAGEMESKWLLGYGYGSGSIAAAKLYGYDNVQNAMLHWILQGGILLAVGLSMLIILTLRSSRLLKTDEMESLKPLFALIYTYMALGTVEITYSMAFILWLALVFMVSNDKNNVSL